MKFYIFRGRTALHEAAEMENLEMIKFLIDRNANKEILDSRVIDIPVAPYIIVTNF